MPYHSFHRRPYMYSPFGFGLPFAGGLIGGLALGSMFNRPNYYPYYNYPYYNYPPYYFY